MAYAHDDDDPFYDHDEALAQAAASRVSALVSTSTRPSALPASLVRASHQTGATGRSTTLSRPTSAGRSTTTFDAFLSDSSDDSDDDDDGAAIQRMQEQADDMAYIDAAFQFDSPNGPPSDDASTRLEPTRLLSTHRGTVVSATDASAQAPPGGSAAWTRRISRAASQHSDSDQSSDGSSGSPVTRRFTGHRDSFVKTRARDASVDTLSSSFRLFSPTAALAVAAHSVDSASYLSSGDFSDSSLVLSSPPPVSSSAHFDDDSFVSVRPSALDALFDERLDDSFTGDRPSHASQDSRESADDSFASARLSLLSQESRTSIDDSYASRRPSNLSQGSRPSIDASFVSPRPSTLSRSSGGSTDTSVVGPRPSTLDRASRSSIDNAFIGERPTSLLRALRDASDSSDVCGDSTGDADSPSDSESDDDEPLSMLHLPEGIDADAHVVAQFRLSSPNTVHHSAATHSICTSGVAALPREAAASASDAPVVQDALKPVAVLQRGTSVERRSSTQAPGVETWAAAAAVDALALSYLSDPADAVVDSVAPVFQLESPNRQSVLAAASARAAPAPLLMLETPTTALAPSVAVVQAIDRASNGATVPPASCDELAAAAGPAPTEPALASSRLPRTNAETVDDSVAIEVLAPRTGASEQPSVAAKPETGVASWVRRLSQLAPSDDSNDNDIEGSDSDRETLDASPQWAFAALRERSGAPPRDARASSAHSVAALPPPLRPTAQSMATSTAASGFQWHEQMTQRLHADSRSDESSSGGGLSLKESIWHQASIPRPTRPSVSAAPFHRFSTSLRSTLERTGARLFGQSPPQPFGPSNEPTSPKSVCSSPPKLARSFDDRNFYARFARGGGVDDTDELIATKRALGRQYTTASVLQKRRARTIVLLLCTLLGIGVGIALIHIDAFAAAFAPASGHGDAVAIATQWLLLPGTLFLRLWHCVTMPLVFCHVLTGTADLVLNGKAHMALSVRSIGFMLAVSAVTTLEGVGLMAAAQYFGLFRPSSTSSSPSVETTAAELRASLGAVAYDRGTVALLCESEQRTYLHSLNRGQSFQCSNASSVSLSTVVAAATARAPSVPSAALFVLHDVEHALRPATLSPSLSSSSYAAAAYYPRAMSLDEVSRDVVDALVPHNIAQSLLDATPVSTIALALLLGLVCGKRAFDRAIAAQHEGGAAHGASRGAGTPILGAGTPILGASVADKPHYVLGAVVELQLALEWLIEALEPLAPVGALSLLAGTVALYHTELLTFVAPMLALVLSVAGACLVHVLVVTPVAMKLSVDVNVVATWGQTFVPAYAMCFSTESVVLSLPTVQQCYAAQSAMVSTKRSGLAKSMAQASVSVLSVLHRNGHALYYPLALLWLLETTSAAGPDTTGAVAAALTTDQCALIAAWTLASCFVALHSAVGAVSSRPGRSNVLLIVSLWRAVLAMSSTRDALSPAAAAPTAMPSTLPLLIACDVLLSRVVAMVHLHGNMVVARLIGEHCDEVIVQGTARNSIDLAPSPVFL